MALPARRSTFQRVVRILVRKRLMTAALVVLLIMGLSSLFAGWIAPYSYVATDTANSLSSPTQLHWFGSDSVGADTFTRSFTVQCPACGDGAIRPTLVQRAGRGVTSATEMLRGFPVRSGTELA